MFLDISKAFDRVWHDGLLFKLEKNGVSGNLFQLIKSFLSDRFQRVLPNGQRSDWETIQAGVPQDSILGPLFFLIYINDLADNLNNNVKLFGDDTFWSFRDCKCTKLWLKKMSCSSERENLKTFRTQTTSKIEF